MENIWQNQGLDLRQVFVNSANSSICLFPFRFCLIKNMILIKSLQLTLHYSIIYMALLILQMFQICLQPLSLCRVTLHIYFSFKQLRKVPLVSNVCVSPLYTFAKSPVRHTQWNISYERTDLTLYHKLCLKLLYFKYDVSGSCLKYTNIYA